MQSDFSPKIWNEIKEAVQSAIATAHPLDVAAEAKRIAMANCVEKVALADIADSLVRLSLPARVVLFFSEKGREDAAGVSKVMGKVRAHQRVAIRDGALLHEGAVYSVGDSS
jgi:hypothetical protein